MGHRRGAVAREVDEDGAHGPPHLSSVRCELGHHAAVAVSLLVREYHDHVDADLLVSESADDLPRFRAVVDVDGLHPAHVGDDAVLAVQLHQTRVRCVDHRVRPLAQAIRHRSEEVSHRLAGHGALLSVLPALLGLRDGSIHGPGVVRRDEDRLTERRQARGRELEGGLDRLQHLRLAGIGAGDLGLDHLVRAQEPERVLLRLRDFLRIREELDRVGDRLIGARHEHVPQVAQGGHEAELRRDHVPDRRRVAEVRERVLPREARRLDEVHHLTVRLLHREDALARVQHRRRSGDHLLGRQEAEDRGLLRVLRRRVDETNRVTERRAALSAVVLQEGVRGGTPERDRDPLLQSVREGLARLGRTLLGADVAVEGGPEGDELPDLVRALQDLRCPDPEETVLLEGGQACRHGEYRHREVTIVHLLAHVGRGLQDELGLHRGDSRHEVLQPRERV